MDLAAWVAAGRWVALLDLIDMLPRDSRLREAQLNDPEYAEMLVALEDETDESEEWAPTVAENNLVTELLSSVIYELRCLRNEQIAVASRKKPRPGKPVPGPRTAVEKAREKAAEVFAEQVLGRFGF